MSFNVTLETRKPGVILAKLSGRLDSTTASACEESLQPLLKKRTRVLLLDLKNVDFISSMGLRVVLKAQKAICGGNRHVLLLHVQPQVAKVFELADILPTTSIFDSVESADIFLEAVQNKEILKDQDVSD